MVAIKTKDCCTSLLRWKTSIAIIALFSVVMLLYLVKDLSVGDVKPISRQEQSRPIVLDAEANIVSTIGKLNNTNFIIELDDNQPRQFHSGILNFSYKSSRNSFAAYRFFFKYDLRNFKKQQRMDWKGYIRVGGVGQELSMCTKHLLTLVFLANSGPRKVVAPRMAKGYMGTVGAPFGEFFDLPHLNQMLSHYEGYSEIAAEDEYHKACKGQPKTFLNILYSKSDLPNTISRRGNASTLIPHIYKRVMEDGWAECSALSGKPTDNNTRFYCIKHALMFQNMSLLEQKVLKDTKCVYIPKWKGPWRETFNNFAKIFKRKGIPDPIKMFVWLIKPSVAIMDEVRTFQELYLQRPYVAIHIRGAKFKNKAYIPRCFKIALEIVRALRLTRNVKTLFLATDMSQFGGQTNRDKTSHKSFAEQSGAVIYDPNVTKKMKVIDNWTVSLTEVMLLSQSDHLITIGYGSFFGFILNRFITQHLKKDPTTWSWTRICFQTGMKHNIAKKP